jgi:hypothetical protein
MQEMTTAICATATTPNASATTYITTYTADKTKVPQTTLRDTRDNKTYTVRKLADGHCWMTDDYKTAPTRVNGTTYWYNQTQARNYRTGSFVIPHYSYVANLRNYYSATQVKGFPLNFSSSGGYYQNTGAHTTEHGYYWNEGYGGSNSEQRDQPCYTIGFPTYGESIGHTDGGCGCTSSEPCLFSLRYMAI